MGKILTMSYRELIILEILEVLDEESILNDVSSKKGFSIFCGFQVEIFVLVP